MTLVTDVMESASTLPFSSFHKLVPGYYHFWN